jgi:hypothetical protein
MRIENLIIVVLVIKLFIDVDPREEMEALSLKHPKEPAVILQKITDYDIKIVNDSLLITASIYEETGIIGENGANYARDQIYSSSFVKLKNLKASTLIPNKKKWKLVPVTDFRQIKDDDNSVFYDDSEYTTFTFPGVQKYTKTQVSYDHIIKDPHFLGSTFFSSYAPVELARLTFTVDSKISLKFKAFNSDNVSIVSKTSNKDGRTVFSFELKDIEKVTSEISRPGFNHIGIHIGAMIESYEKSNGDIVRILSKPEDLYNWYYKFIDGLKESKSVQISSIVDDLISDNDTELEKVKKIYYWVQNNIKYIAFEEGMRGFIPHDGNYVYEKRYGDCKDMSSIIINMLHHAGIDAYYTWIGTRALPYKYNDWPTPGVDNHMIATYINEGQYYFLDATGQYQPFGMPTSMIQGKEALIGFSDKKFEIHTIPIISKEKNIMTDEFEYSLEKGSIKGSGSVTLSGYAKVFNTYRMVNSSHKATDDYINRLLNRGNNKFFVEEYTIDSIDDLDKDISLNYRFRVEDYYSEINGKIYFNMNMDKAFSNATIEKDRKYKKESEYKYINRSISRLKIPAGFEINYLPEDSQYESSNFGYQFKYSVQESMILLEREFYLNYLVMEPKDFQTWDNAIKKFTEDNKQILILSKKQ